jgi:integrase
VRLKWKNLIFEDTEGIKQYYLSFIIKKTGKPNKIPINNDALSILGERKGDDDLIVSGLKYSANNNNILREWSLLAGIKKIITPHTARHTFATRYLTQTNDIYGLQNLIGHKELKTTQVYMHLVDDKLKKNVNSLNSLME